MFVHILLSLWDNSERSLKKMEPLNSFPYVLFDIIVIGRMWKQFLHEIVSDKLRIITIHHIIWQWSIIGLLDCFVCLCSLNEKRCHVTRDVSVRTAACGEEEENRRRGPTYTRWEYNPVVLRLVYSWRDSFEVRSHWEVYLNQTSVNRNI